MPQIFTSIAKSILVLKKSTLEFLRLQLNYMGKLIFEKTVIIWFWMDSAELLFIDITCWD